MIVGMDKPDMQQVLHHYAGVLLITEDDRIIGQQRDDKPGIDHPGKVGTFGGALEHDETPREGAWRELVQEETNLKLTPKDLTLLYEDVDWRELTQEWEGRHFYYARITADDLEHLEVYEGQGWAEITGADDPDIIELWRPVVRAMLTKLSAKQ